MTSQLVPPFDADSAQAKVQHVADAWNTQDPNIIVQAYSAQCLWRYRQEFVQGRKAIKALLVRKSEQELHYRLVGELWSFTNQRLSVCFEYEWQESKSGQWHRTHTNEHWEFGGNGLLVQCDTSANDIPINASARRIGF